MMNEEYGILVEWYLVGETEALGRKPAPVQSLMDYSVIEPGTPQYLVAPP
jgi:hypothetical protein